MGQYTKLALEHSNFLRKIFNIVQNEDKKNIFKIQKVVKQMFIYIILNKIKTMA